jgi:hypothetical protein
VSASIIFCRPWTWPSILRSRRRVVLFAGGIAAGGPPGGAGADGRAALGAAEALNRLGELAARTADSAQAREHHTQALAIARDPGAAQKKHAPWKDSAKPTSRTATPAKLPRTWRRHWRSTSASAPLAPSAPGKLSRGLG